MKLLFGENPTTWDRSEMLVSAYEMILAAAFNRDLSDIKDKREPLFNSYSNFLGEMARIILQGDIETEEIEEWIKKLH